MKFEILESSPCVQLLTISVCWMAMGCSSKIEKLWEFQTGSPIYSSPLVTGDLIVFGSENGTLHAIDKNGKSRWRFTASSAEIFGKPTTDSSLIFFGATNQKFYAVDLNGRNIWQFSAKERIKSEGTVSGDRVYITSYDGHVYALDTKTGELVWRFPEEAQETAKPAPDATPPPPQQKKDSETETTTPTVEPKAFSYAAPQIVDGVLYVGNLDGYLYAISIADGSLRWRYKTDGGITSTALIQEQTIFFGSKDDYVYAIDQETGSKTKWKYKTKDDVLSSPRFADGMIYVGSNDKNFYVLDAKTGTEKCHLTTLGPIVSSGTMYQDLIFFGGGQADGYIYAMNRKDCKVVFKYKTGYKIESDPEIAGNKVYITSGDRKIYAFKINPKD